MSQREQTRTVFSSPFCRDYWKQASADLHSPRMLIFAALMVGLRVALKPVGIPLAGDLRINVAFFVNAYGAMVFGPLVAILGAIISDILGYLIFPSGVYFPPFILTEVAGSVIFALFLYRCEVTSTRVILSRFCIDLFVNVLMTAPIMAMYYTMILGKNYALFDVMRIVKNLAMFPVESILLILFLKLTIPVTRRMGMVVSGTDGLRFTKRTVISLALMLAVGAGLTAAYLVNSYNTTSFSAQYSPQERLERNTEMTQWIREQHPELGGDNLLAVIESARSKVGRKEMTYEVAVYELDPAKAEEEGLTREKIQGYSKSKAAAEPALTRRAGATAVTDKHSGEHLSLEVRPEMK